MTRLERGDSECRPSPLRQSEDRVVKSAPPNTCVPLSTRASDEISSCPPRADASFFRLDHSACTTSGTCMYVAAPLPAVVEADVVAVFVVDDGGDDAVAVVDGEAEEEEEEESFGARSLSEFLHSSRSTTYMGTNHMSAPAGRQYSTSLLQSSLWFAEVAGTAAAVEVVAVDEVGMDWLTLSVSGLPGFASLSCAPGSRALPCC